MSKTHHLTVVIVMGLVASLPAVSQEAGRSEAPPFAARAAAVNIQGMLRAASWAPGHKDAQVSCQPRPEACLSDLLSQAQDSFENRSQRQPLLIWSARLGTTSVEFSFGPLMVQIT